MFIVFFFNYIYTLKQLLWDLLLIKKSQLRIQLILLKQQYKVEVLNLSLKRVQNQQVQPRNLLKQVVQEEVDF